MPGAGVLVGRVRRKQSWTITWMLLLLGCSVGSNDSVSSFGSGQSGPQLPDGSSSTSETSTSADSVTGETTNSTATAADDAMTSGAETTATSGSSGMPGETAAPSTCGDDVAEGDEACDGSDLRGETCESQGFAGGLLGCAMDCSAYQFGGCQAPKSCGDGVKNGTEQCDGADLGGQNCTTLGWDMGALACTANCSFNTSGCQDEPCAPIFGDCSQMPCCEDLFCYPLDGNTCGPPP